MVLQHSQIMDPDRATEGLSLHINEVLSEDIAGIAAQPPLRRDGGWSEQKRCLALQSQHPITTARIFENDSNQSGNTHPQTEFICRANANVGFEAFRSHLKPSVSSEFAAGDGGRGIDVSSK